VSALGHMSTTPMHTVNQNGCYRVKISHTHNYQILIVMRVANVYNANGLREKKQTWTPSMFVYSAEELLKFVKQ
jgi:hypothetical protein